MLCVFAAVAVAATETDAFVCLFVCECNRVFEICEMQTLWNATTEKKKK